MNTKEKLMQLLELCIEKRLDFESCTNTVAATRWEGDNTWLFRERIWLSNDIETNDKHLDELITKVKNYQP